MENRCIDFRSVFLFGFVEVRWNRSIGFRTVKGGPEVFGDGDGKVGEVGLLVPWQCPFSCMTYTDRMACFS